MHTVITGATGFVGYHLYDHLLACGHTVIGLSSAGQWSDRAQQDWMAKGLTPPKVERIDLTGVSIDPLSDWLSRSAPEVIYHLAAQANPQQSLQNPRKTWNINLIGTLNLLEAIRQSGISTKVLLVGTGVSYGKPAADQIPVNEKCPLQPTTPYATSKAAADLLGVQYALSHGLHTVIVRPFNHGGPGQSDRYVLSSLAKQVVMVELGLQPKIQVGNLDVVRDFTDVRDVVQAYRMLGEAEGTIPGEIFNLGSGRGTQLNDALQSLTEMSDSDPWIEIDPDRYRPTDLPLLICDSSRLRAATGWRPILSIEQTLRDLLQDWRKQLSEESAV